MLDKRTTYSVCGSPAEPWDDARDLLLPCIDMHGVDSSSDRNVSGVEWGSVVGEELSLPCVLVDSGIAIVFEADVVMAGATRLSL